MSELVNKTYRTWRHPSTDESTRAIAFETFMRLTDGKEVSIAFVDGDDDELTKLRREYGALRVADRRLTDRLIAAENALARIYDALKSRKILDITDLGAMDRAFQNNAKQWVIDQVAAAGVDGITKLALQAMVSSKEDKGSISRRWSEVQNENWCFIVGDRLVVLAHAKAYPAEFKAHNKRLKDKRESGVIRVVDRGVRSTRTDDEAEMA